MTKTAKRRTLMSHPPTKQRFSIYLRTFGGRVSEKTVTADQASAEAAFKSLVGRADLDGQKLAVALMLQMRQIALHRFDRSPGDADYWRDKLQEIPWPAAPGPVGRPATMNGGKRVQVYLDGESIEQAKLLGAGNVSEGIRLALARAGMQPTQHQV